MAGGTLTVEGELHVGGDFRQRAGTLTVTVPGRCRDDLLTVAGDAELGGTLSVDGSAGRDVTVLRARRVSGRFATVVAPAGLGARVSYSRTAVTVRLHKAWPTRLGAGGPASRAHTGGNIGAMHGIFIEVKESCLRCSHPAPLGPGPGNT